MGLPATAYRVAMHTDGVRNRKIMQEMEHRLWYYLEHPQEIEQRLGELDREWDMERVLETNAATIALSGVLAGAAFGRKFLLVPGVVTAFLLQHALQGWCPPVPVFRRLGVRTQYEIELERYALKALRGDFRGVDLPPAADEARRDHPRRVLQAMAHRRVMEWAENG